MKINLVSDWRKAWKWSSIHLAAIFAFTLAALVENVSWIVALIQIIPKDSWRYVLSIGIFLSAFGLPLFFRITRIKWRHDDNETNAKR